LRIAPAEGVGLLSDKVKALHNNTATATAKETEKDGAMGQVKAMDTDSIDKDENKAKKDMEDSKENSKEETKVEEVILFSKT